MNVDAKPFIPQQHNVALCNHAVAQQSNGGDTKQTHKDKRPGQRRRPKRTTPKKVGSVQQAINMGGKQGSYYSSPKPQHDGDNEIPANNKDKGGSQQNLSTTMTKHQKQTHQKQHRRRRRNNRNKGDINITVDQNIKSDEAEGCRMNPLESENMCSRKKDGKGKEKETNNSSRRSRNRRNRKHKSKSNEPGRNEALQSGLIETIEDEDTLPLNANSFPSLGGAVSTSPAADIIDKGGDNTMLWREISLASKISSLELERQQEEELNRKMEQDQQILSSNSSVKLTMLSSKSSQTITSETEGGEENSMHIIDKNVEEEVDNTLPKDSSLLVPPSTPQVNIESNNTNNAVIPNTKTKWTGSELSKMRQRWWEAVQAKRKKLNKEKRNPRQLGSSIGAAKYSQQPGSGKDENNSQDEHDSSSVGSLSSSSVSSELSSDDDSLVNEVSHHDHMQPPSLSKPFDEAAMTSMKQDRVTSTLPVPQPILDLERICVESGHPLHCAIYNHALVSSDGASLHICNNYEVDHNGNASESSEKSNAEVVLHRLLTMQSSDDVMRWKFDQVALPEMRGLEAKTVEYQESRAKSLTDVASTTLFSADATSLTPLQLAIYWNLPSIIRLLYTTTRSTSFVNKSEEEDEHGRTPLMLACELGHVACIQAVLCSSMPKLDRRERKGGNTAFHFCCMGRQLSEKQILHRHLGSDSDDEDGEEDNYDGNHQGCVEAIGILLRYTPSNLQKRALMLTNKDGQNVFHMASTRSDFGLIERLLECHNLPGVKISKALDAKDRFGYTPFLAAVAADALDIVMHLLTSRFSGFTPDFASWFAGCPLVVAASKNSVEMTRLLLDLRYDASSLTGATRQVTGVGNEAVNRALLETIYRLSDEEEDRSKTYEIIGLLISQGGGNPHQSVPRCDEKPRTQGGRSVLLSHLRGRMVEEDTPLSAAVRSHDATAVQCMIDTYTGVLTESKEKRRNDPMLQSQPFSYFRLLETKEDDVVYASVDAAIVTACFLLWKGGSSSDEYGKCALTLYKRGRLNLSLTGVPRHLSQRALQWLEHCMYMHQLVPAPMHRNKDNSMHGYSFEAPVVQYMIPAKKRDEKVPYHDAGVNYMDYSHVLAELPWFRPQRNGLCGWMRDILSSTDTKQVEFQSVLAEDEFYLVVDGEKLLAHKSIISARSAKLAAQIRFTEEQVTPNSRLEVQVDLPLLYAKMLLCHCYHGSIVLGLTVSLLQQCNQLLEVALIAEEYLCPTLLLECEMRLLMQTSFYEKKNGISCLCPYCSGRNVYTEDATCPIQLKCLEFAKANIDSFEHCQPAGIYAYKASTILSNQSGLITPQSALDVLAVAQQLEQLSPGQQGIYAIKYFRSGDSASTMAIPSVCEGTTDAKKDDHSGCIYTPFSIAKKMAIWVMLREFSAVIRSDCFLRQVQVDCDGVETDALVRGNNDDESILLLRTCLEELESSPFRKNEEKRFLYPTI